MTDIYFSKVPTPLKSSSGILTCDELKLSLLTALPARAIEAPDSLEKGEGRFAEENLCGLLGVAHAAETAWRSGDATTSPMTGSEPLLSLGDAATFFASSAENVCFGALPGSSTMPCPEELLRLEDRASKSRCLLMRRPLAGSDLAMPPSSPTASVKKSNLSVVCEVPGLRRFFRRPSSPLSSTRVGRPLLGSVAQQRSARSRYLLKGTIEKDG